MVKNIPTNLLQDQTASLMNGISNLRNLNSIVGKKGGHREIVPIKLIRNTHSVQKGELQINSTQAHHVI